MRTLLLTCCLIPLLLQAQCPQNTPWEKVIPSEHIPDSLYLCNGNNNLDAVEYKGRYYLAIRNAPNHFASRYTRIIVFSSADMVDWGVEHQVHIDNDMREPRFIAFRDSLYLYFFEGGSKFWKFEPQHIHFCVYHPSSGWSQHEDAGLDGYVPWRIREHKGKLYLSAYYGANIYGTNKEVELRLYVSEDARSWRPISEEPQLKHHRSVSEGEFVFDEEGNIWGVARLEYDGAYVFKANKDNIAKWEFVFSEKKYDSSLMFVHEGEIYLIARRNLDGDGSFTKVPGKPTRNLLRYSVTKKKTALFRLDRDKLEWVHLKDFASTGDTAFPGIIPMGDGSYTVFNYSSDIDKRSKSWIVGQLGKTYIYKSLLQFEECPQ